MLIVLMIFATALLAGWLMFLGRATRDDWITSAYCAVIDNMEEERKLISKDKARLEKYIRSGRALRAAAQVLSRNSGRKIERLRDVRARIQKGDIRRLNILLMPGFVMQREIEAIGKGGIHKSIMTKSFEMYGKKHAENKSKQLLAKLLSYPIVGIAFCLLLGVILIGRGSSSAGAAVLIIGTALVLVVVYAMYDELCDKVRKRRTAIGKQFPGVVSKLALLVTSGMIMDRAWKETAYSQDSEVYLEMRKTAEELDNLVGPDAAYGNFINRCNTKETAKLASALLQNTARGNAEIGRLLKSMAHEAWQERRRTAKKEADRANSKLMIPTMLLFLAILVMLMVPVVLNFTGM